MTENNFGTELTKTVSQSPKIETDKNNEDGDSTYIQITKREEIIPEINTGIEYTGQNIPNSGVNYTKGDSVSLDPNGEVKLLYPKGNKTIVCWNCLSVLMVRDEWNVVECSECHKFNRVPHESNTASKDTHVKLMDDYNHFDVDIPYVFAIITCPFCQTENRFRRDADHIVCYKCHHSFNIRNPAADTNTFNYGYGYNCNYYPKFRWSNFYPGIIGWRGVYPQPIVFSSCECSGTEIMLEKILDSIKKNRPKQKIILPYDRYVPIRRYIHDIDDLDYIRERGRTPNYRYDQPAPLPCCKHSKNDDKDAFKITIKKKLVDPDTGMEIKNSKSTAFEKVLYTKKRGYSVDE